MNDNDWVQRVKYYLITFEQGEAEALRFLAADAYANSTQANAFETTTQGRPGMMTVEHQKVAMAALAKAGELRIEQMKIETNRVENGPSYVQRALARIEELKEDQIRDDLLVINIPPERGPDV